MGCKAYIGIDNTSRNIKKCYVGVDGVARKIKKAYIGVNGIARLCYISEITNSILPCNSTTATGSILHAMGIFHGTAHTDWDSLVTAVVGHLGSLGFVTADGKIKLSALGAGITMIPGAIISAVRDFLFAGDCPALILNSDFVPTVFSGNSFVLYSSDSRLLHCSDVISYIIGSSYGPAFSSAIAARGVSLSDLTFCALSVQRHSSISDYTFAKFYFTSLPSLTFNKVSGQDYYISNNSSGSYLLQFQINDGSFSLRDSSPVGDSCFYTYPPLGNSNMSNVFVVSNIGALPTGLISNGDYDINAASEDGLNSQDNIDVIYPGWATNATNVDTNIDVVADAGTGAIDGVITADKYYPLGISDLGTSIYDQTQAGAQTGTNAVLLI